MAAHRGDNVALRSEHNPHNIEPVKLEGGRGVGDRSASPRRQGHESEAHVWKRLQNPTDEAPPLEILPLVDSLRNAGCQFYPESEADGVSRDSRMYQRLAIVEYLKTIPSVCLSTNGASQCTQVDHIAVLSRESFDFVRQTVTASKFEPQFAQFLLKDTQWARIRELYRSLVELQKRHETMANISTWSILMDAKPLNTSDERNTFPLPGEAEAMTADSTTLAIDDAVTYKKVSKRDFVDNMTTVLTFVSSVLCKLIPPHVFELGSLPTDEELKQLGAFANSNHTFQRMALYNVFSTNLDDRRAGLRGICKYVGIVGDSNERSSLKEARSLGNRVHATISNLRNCKARALCIRRDNEKFLRALKNVSSHGSGILLSVVGRLVDVVDSIDTSPTWTTNLNDVVGEFCEHCAPPATPPTPIVAVSVHVACSHFIGGVLMGDCKGDLVSVADAILDDRARMEPRTIFNKEPKPYTRDDHKTIVRTTLLFDVKALAGTGSDIVAGDVFPHHLRSFMTSTMIELLVQLTSCSKLVPLPLTESDAQHEPSVPLPTGMLQQTEPYHVSALLHSGCTIVDIGFRSDGRYAVEDHQGLTISFYEREEGQTLSEAISQALASSGLLALRFEGSTVINNVRRSVAIRCRNTGGAITYRTTVDGQDISDENPVTVVLATDDTDPNQPIPFYRIAQYVTGTSWRKPKDGRGPAERTIADKAVQVAAAYLADLEMRELSCEASTHDILNSVVYQSSKQLLDDLDHLRKRFEDTWASELNLNNNKDLAMRLLQMLTTESRVLALASRELPHAISMLGKLQYAVKPVQVDNLSFVAKRAMLEDRSKKPSISFVHLRLVGHLDASRIKEICDLVQRTSLRLLVVASPSTQFFAMVPALVMKTDLGKQQFRPSFVQTLKQPILVPSIEAIAQNPRGMVQRLKRFTGDVLSSLRHCSGAYDVTLLCNRERPPLGIEEHVNESVQVFDLRSVDNAHSKVRGALTRRQHIVGDVDNPSPTLALFTHGDKLIDTHFIYVPLPMDTTPSLAKLLGIETPVDLTPEWAAVEQAMTYCELKINFVDFVCVVPACEWLDQRNRVQLYFHVVWNVPLEVTAQALAAVRNVTSLSLAETLMVTKEQNKRAGRDGGASIEVAPSYNEYAVGGTVTLKDVLSSCIASRVDIPWNMCSAKWNSAAPFSSLELTQVLSVYPFPLRLLITVGPSLFHTLNGVELFADRTPLSWAVEVARRLDFAAGLVRDGHLPEEHMRSLSVVRWLFISLGWNDKITVANAPPPLARGHTQHEDAYPSSLATCDDTLEHSGDLLTRQTRTYLDRNGQPLCTIALDQRDFLALDKENIVMDILEAPPGCITSRRAAMSAQTRHSIVLMLATLQGSPNLFSKQPQIQDYFFRLPEQGGITKAAAANLMRCLLDPLSDRRIGAPFLSILRDTSLNTMCGLRNVVEVDELWCWCNSDASAVAPLRIVNALSQGAWAYLFACQPTPHMDRLLGLFDQSNQSKRVAFNLSPILSEAMSMASDVPGATNAVTTVVLSRHEGIESAPDGIDHLLALIRGELTRDAVVELARTTDPNGAYRQFCVELETGDTLSQTLLEQEFFSERAPESEFFTAVLFVGRCLSEPGRRSLLHKVALKLGVPDPSIPGGVVALEIAAAALWLYQPLAPSPLSTTARVALKKMERFLRLGEEMPVHLQWWSEEEVKAARRHLRSTASNFHHVVAAESDSASEIALALVGMHHYLPTAFLRSLGDAGIIKAPEEHVTNIVVQGVGWPTYTLAYALRPLPQTMHDQLFAPQQYDLTTPSPSFDVSRGVSKELVQKNLAYFVHLKCGSRYPYEKTAARLCIVLWLKCLGFFVGCNEVADCKARLCQLEVGEASEMKRALTEFTKDFNTHSNTLRGTGAVVSTVTFPSFMELQVLRRSSMVQLFDCSTLGSVLYTLRVLSSVLRVLPTAPKRPSGTFLHRGNSDGFRGEEFLANLVFPPSSLTLHERDNKLDECARVVACEVGFQLGAAWGGVDARSQATIAQSVVNNMFTLLAEFPEKAQTLFLMMVDVALEQLDGDTNKTQRAYLSSALVMAIGFQDKVAVQTFLLPLLDLLGGSCPVGSYEGIMKRREHKGNHQRTFLTKHVACEIVFWRDAAEILPPTAASGWMKKLKSWETLADSIRRDERFPKQPDGNADTFLVDVGKLEGTGGARPHAGRESLERDTPTAPAQHCQYTLFREAAASGASISDTKVDDDTHHGAPHPPAALLGALPLVAQPQTESTVERCVIDVSAIVHLHISRKSLITGATLKVRAGLGCALLCDVTKRLRIVPLSQLREFKSSTIRCFFEDYGEAWEYCDSAKHPCALVGSGFLLATTGKGWRMTLGRDHGTDAKLLRPWHLLAFHRLVGQRLHGPAEDRIDGGVYSLLEWLCRQAYAYVRPSDDTVDEENLQAIVCALVAQHSDDLDAINGLLVSLMDKTFERISESRDLSKPEDVRSSIHSAIEAITLGADTRARCGLDQSIVISSLVHALQCSLHLISTASHPKDGPQTVSGDAQLKRGSLNKYLRPGGEDQDQFIKRFLEAPTKQNLKRRYGEIQRRQNQSETEVLQAVGQAVDSPSDAFAFVADTLCISGTVGDGLQSVGCASDVVYGFAEQYNVPTLSFLPVERKERYHPTYGLVAGFLLSKSVLELKDTAQANTALANQWTLQVLRSPLPTIWKEWFVMHLHTEAVWMPEIPKESLGQKQMIVAQLLALRCEVSRVREIVTGAFEGLPQHCTRCNRVYGVIAMFNPPISEWISAGFDVREHRFTDTSRLRDEEAFRLIIAKFNQFTTHVVVYGYDEKPMSDTLLKWLCEYTFRYPWRFFILVNCDTTTNLPENRDRVTNFISLQKCLTNSIVLPVEASMRTCDVFIPLISDIAQKMTKRSCEWSSEVEALLTQPVALIHLISPPGGGKSTLMQELDGHPNIGKLVRVDCSDDRLVEEALQSLLDEALAGAVTNDHANNGGVVLVADEYHMLPERKKEEFMRWAQGKLRRVKIVMIANRADPLDKKLLTSLHDAYFDCRDNIKSIEGRISASKVYQVIRKSYSLSPEKAKAQSKAFYTFLATLRGMLGDDAVSLRLEEHFPRVDASQKVNNYNFTKKLQDKLIMFGQESIFRILNCYEQIRTAAASALAATDVKASVVRLYKASMHGSPTKLLVFTSMLVPLLHYVDPLQGSSNDLCDKVLCYRELVEEVSGLRSAPCAIRLAMWVRYVLALVDIELTDTEHAAVFRTLRTLKLVDFPDFPIIEGESSLTQYTLSEQRSTYVDHDDLTDLDWINNTLARRMAVNWHAVKLTWNQTPVTDSDKLCTIIDGAGPTTVFNAMAPHNVLQLLKRNPDGAFRGVVLREYPFTRALEDAQSDESPFFFAAYTSLVMQSLETDLSKHFDEILSSRGGQGTETKIGKLFVKWISNHGAMVASVPDKAVERTEAIVRLIVKISQKLRFSSDEHAELWRGKYLAPAAELFNAAGEELIPLKTAVDIVNGHGRKQHNKWPQSMKLLHRVLKSNSEMLTETEAIWLLESRVHMSVGVPSRLIGAILQAEPCGRLSLRHQEELLDCSTLVGPSDLNSDAQYEFNVIYNVKAGLHKKLTQVDAPKLRCQPIQQVFSRLKKESTNSH